MALYLGRDKIKINIDGVIYKLNLYKEISPEEHDMQLLSFDGYILKDKNDIYLIPKEGE